MKSYIVYNAASGDIVRSGRCQDSDVGLQPDSGQGVIEHDRIDDTLYKVDLETLQIVEI